jgi:N-methylhydantoinase A
MNEPRLGIDIGGTFTDVVMRLPDGGERMAKIPTVRADPSTAVERILAALLPEWGMEAARIARFVHGTTVATNAVLERKGATIGILATRGFEDVIEIGRQRRRDMYDLAMRPETPAFLAPGRRRRGVVEEIGPDGAVIVPLDEASLIEAVDALVVEGVEAIAVAFLFSFANPEHERAAARLVAERHPGIFVSLSSEVDPAFREYERTAVTAFDAYVKPVLDRYLARMEERLDDFGDAATAL